MSTLDDMLIQALREAPVYPNLMYEMNRAGYTIVSLARSMDKKPKTVRKILRGAKPLNTFIINHILQTLRCSDSTYLFYSPATTWPTDEEIDVAAAIISTIRQGYINHEDTRFNVYFRSYDPQACQRGQLLIRTLLNLTALSAAAHVAAEGRQGIRWWRDADDPRIA